MARLRGSAWVFGGQFYGLLLAFPTGILIARALGADGKGTITVVQLIAGVSTVLLGLGLPGIVTHLSARGEIDGPSVSRIAWLWALLVSGALMLASQLAGREIARVLLPGARADFLFLGALAAMPAMVNVLNSSFLMGKGRTRAYALLNASTQTGQLGCLVALWALNSLTPWSAVISWLIVTSAGALAGTLVIIRVRADAPIRTLSGLFSRGWKFGLASWLASGLGLLSLRLDMFLLSAFLGTVAVGLYSVSVTLAEMAWQLPNAVYAVMFPKISAEGAASADLAARVNRVLWPLTMALSLGIALVAIWLVPVLFGKGFASAVLPLWLLIPGIIAYSIGIVPSAYLAGVGRPQAGAWASAANILVNLALNVVLIPRYGLGGAAVASSFSYAASSIMLVAWFGRASGVSLGQTLVPRRADARMVSDAVRAEVLRRGVG